ncbi:butyrophilin subfamily 2 member A2-like isoform X6 [Oncorhynchus kisutch]|uniref:butyrophilin subfamily 2 member A2-like isoform X6 n=1 Tax=Oncorhynchus kisutch TaxID=8019 RepID=UPI0012DBF0A1|nr:butyrophilin subfamily 2 member A2-like isoform X6 [Oncorhynchus kisutch]
MKTFPTSAVWCFGILFISASLITTGSSEVQVVGPADRVDALAGDDIILPCSLKPNISAKDMLVQWTGLYLKTRNVHLYRQGRDSNEDQFPSYRGRTSMFHEELKNGNVSLKLTRVTLSDAGSYRCFLPTLTSQVKETTVQLFVGAVSQPVISIVGTKDWGVVLKCESGGWFPEPEMEWLDSSGTILPADGPPERHRDSEDLYALRRHVTVDQTDTNRFTCRVHQTEINHLKETEIHVPDDVFPKSHVGLIIGLSILLAVVVLAASAGVYKWRKHTDKVTRERDGLKGELMELREENNKLKIETDNVKMEREELREENNNVKMEREKFRKDNDKLKIETVELREENNKLKIETDNVKMEREELREENNKLKIETDKLKIETDNVKMEREKFRKDNDKLKIETDNVKMEREKFRKDNDKLKIETDNVKMEREKFRKDNDKLKIETDNVKMEREKFRKDNDNVKMEREKFRKDNDKLKIETDNVKMEREELREENNKLKIETDNVKMEREELREENNKLKIETDNVKMEREELREENNKLKIETDNVKMEREELREENKKLKKDKGKLKRPSNPIQSPPLQEVNRKQTPSQKSEGIEGMKLESFPAPEMETLPEG